MVKSIVFIAFLASVLAEQSLKHGSEADSVIQTFEADVSPDGSYQSGFETSNGISVQEQGIGGAQASGQVSYVSPDGTPIQLTYIADENGFHPQGAHLPQPPPIPDAILRSLQWNAAHPEQESDKYAY